MNADLMAWRWMVIMKTMNMIVVVMTVQLLLYLPILMRIMLIVVTNNVNDAPIRGDCRNPPSRVAKTSFLVLPMNLGLSGQKDNTLICMSKGAKATPATKINTRKTR